jgi:hypothetical protein
MGPARILSIILLVVGVGLIVIGVNASHSISDQVSNTFTGHFTQATTWYILGGIAAAVVGFVLLLGGGASGKNA